MSGFDIGWKFHPAYCFRYIEPVDFRCQQILNRNFIAIQSISLFRNDALSFSIVSIIKL